MLLKMIFTVKLSFSCFVLGEISQLEHIFESQVVLILGQYLQKRGTSEETFAIFAV